MVGCFPCFLGDGGRGRRRCRPDGVEGVDHVLRVGLRQLQDVRSAVGDEGGRRQRLGDEVVVGQASKDLGDVEQVALGHGVVDRDVAHGLRDERVDSQGIGDGRVDLLQHGPEELVLALDAAEVRQAVVLPVAVGVHVVQVAAAHQLQRLRPVHHLAARRGDVEARVRVLHGGREAHGDAAQRVDHARESGEADRGVVVDRDVQVLLNGLHEEVRTGVVSGVDAVHARDPADVARDVDPEVTGDGQDRDRLGRRVEAGHHGDVAALTTGVGLVADLAGQGRVVADERPRVRAHQQHVEGSPGGGRLGDQVLGVDLLDLAETVIGVLVDTTGAERGQQHNEGQGIEDAAAPAVLALVVLLVRLAQLLLEVTPGPDRLGGQDGRGAVGVGSGGVGDVGVGGVVRPPLLHPPGYLLRGLILAIVGGQESENTCPGRQIACAR